MIFDLIAIMENQTILEPTSLLFVILNIVLLLSLRRRWAIIPIFLVAFYLTMNLRVVIGGLDFTMLRVIFLFAWVRVIFRSEIYSIDLNIIDKIVIAKIIFSIITYTILWGTTDAFIYQLGAGYDILGFYFIPRALIRSLDEIKGCIKVLLIISIPIALSMTIEQFTGRNVFSFMGGVPELSMVRYGEIRASASFTHPILAGDFGAAILPLFIGLLLAKEINQFRFCIGAISALAIAYFSFSSGPFVAALTGIIGTGLWFFRRRIGTIFWLSIGGLVGLHLVMKAPVWALMTRIGSSGSSYHRFLVLDLTIRRFSDWWLIGTKSTTDWSPYPWIFDMANYYCRTAVDSGLVGLLLFLLIISLCFKVVHRALYVNNISSQTKKFIWCIGASLLVHNVAFFGVSYMGANLFLLYLTFAFLSTIRNLIGIRYEKFHT